MRINKLLVAGMTAAVLLVSAGSAFASGGSSGTGSGGGGGTSGGGTSGGGGGTSGGGGTTSGGGEPCVKINTFSATTSQSAVTANANISSSVSLSLCGGRSDGFAVTVQAVDPNGVVALASSATWVPAGSTPYVAYPQTDAAAFGTTYSVSLKVVNMASNVTDAAGSLTVTTPAGRVAGCATISSLSGREGLIGTENALWAFYTVANCGSSDQLDLIATGTGAAGNVVTNTDSVIVGAGASYSGAHDFDPAPVDSYTLTLTVVEHLTGTVLATLSVAV